MHIIWLEKVSLLRRFIILSLSKPNDEMLDDVSAEHGNIQQVTTVIKSCMPSFFLRQLIFFTRMQRLKNVFCI